MRYIRFNTILLSIDSHKNPWKQLFMDSPLLVKFDPLSCWVTLRDLLKESELEISNENASIWNKGPNTTSHSLFSGSPVLLFTSNRCILHHLPLANGIKFKFCLLHFHSLHLACQVLSFTFKRGYLTCKIYR